MPADSASKIVKFTISIPGESCTNAKAKYSSSVVPPDPSVHFYRCWWMSAAGGRDKRGGPILQFPSESRVDDLSIDDLSTCLSYLTRLPRYGVCW